jgi:hypothetical protein
LSSGLGGSFVVPKGIAQLVPPETFHIIEREERTPTAEPFIPGNLKLKIITFDHLIVSYFRSILLVTRTPQRIASE